MKRREFIAGLGSAVAWPLTAGAQQRAVPVIGFLNGGSSEGVASVLAPFRQGLREERFVEGENVTIQPRWADGQYDRLPALAMELVNRGVAVIAAGSPPAAQAAKAASRSRAICCASTWRSFKSTPRHRQLAFGTQLKIGKYLGSIASRRRHLKRSGLSQVTKPFEMFARRGCTQPRKSSLTVKQSRTCCGVVSRPLSSAGTIANVERLARCAERLAIAIDEFDRDPWLLNTPGGTVDSKTGQMREHRRPDYITKVTAVTPGGTCPRWCAFIDQITGHDPELAAFIQRILGYALTGLGCRNCRSEYRASFSAVRGSPNLGVHTPFGQKTHLTAFSCGLLMIITQEPAQSLAALDAPLSIEVTVPRK
jgi:D5 N terminal like